MDQDIKEIVLTFGGVAIGFALSEVATFVKSRRETTKQGKAFEFEFFSLQPLLKTQIHNFESTYKGIETSDNAPLNISIFKYIQAQHFDYHKLVQYHSRKDKKKAFEIIKNRLSSLQTIEAEIDRFREYYEKYADKRDEISSKYANVAKEFFRTVDSHGKLVNSENKVDVLATDLRKLLLAVLFDTPTLSLPPLKETLHRVVDQLTATDLSHPLKKEIDKFNSVGFDLITDYEAETTIYLGAMLPIITNLKVMYNDLYAPNSLPIS